MLMDRTLHIEESHMYPNIAVHKLYECVRLQNLNFRFSNYSMGWCIFLLVSVLCRDCKYYDRYGSRIICRLTDRRLRRRDRGCRYFKKMGIINTSFTRDSPTFGMYLCPRG
jgi:hypothetical protein